MTRRTVPFGYGIHDGRYVIDAKEAETVRMIFAMYNDGASYAKIAARMTEAAIPYDVRDPKWNKHKVKRILENRKYVGTDVLPGIITEEVFEHAQCIHETKRTTPVRTPKTARDMIWHYIRCEHCGGWCVRCGGANKDRDRDVLVCKRCSAAVQIRKSELEEAVLAQFNAHEYPQTPSYQISEEVMRLNHRINRCLESPEDPVEIIGYILEGITARYACCNDAGCGQAKSRLTEVTPEHFGQVVSGIQVSEQTGVTVMFK